MNKFRLLGAWMTLAAAGSLTAAGGGEYDHANINVHDRASLQRGAALFVNYCMGCHSAQYVRYHRLIDDLELAPEDVE